MLAPKAPGGHTPPLNMDLSGGPGPATASEIILFFFVMNNFLEIINMIYIVQTKPKQIQLGCDTVEI